MKYSLILAVVIIVNVFVAANLAAQNPPAAKETAGTIHLFNGKDLTGFYTYLKDRGKNVDPNKVFTVHDGMLHISGQEFGCVTSDEEFENFHLVMEFKWGEKTWPPRENNARDSGLLVHSVGPDGAYGGMWMHSIECQMIEGGTGDVLVVGDGSDAFSAGCPAAPEKQNDCFIFHPGGDKATIHGGRFNWFGRDPNWKDEKGFRGKQDVEKPIGEWNTYECIADGDQMTLKLNGVVMNQCYDVRPHKGRIQIQSEAAEVFVRRVDITPLPAKVPAEPKK